MDLNASSHQSVINAGSDGDGHSSTHYDTAKEKREFYEHCFPVYTMGDLDHFPMGQYSFNFSFVLGEHLPGSFEKRWHEHGFEAYGKIKYKIKAGLKAESGKSKLFGKKTLVVDEKFLPGQANVAGPMVDKEVAGYCYTSHGKYKMASIFSQNKYIVGDQAIVSVAVDASEASTDIENLKCEFVMKTKTVARGHRGESIEKIQVIDLGRVEAGSTRMDQDSITVQLDIRTPGEMQATASGDIVKNVFYLQWVAKVDGCVYCDKNPTNKIKIGVYNKHFGMPSPPANLMEVVPWQPQQLGMYYAQLNDQQFRMDANFKQAYKPQQ